MSSEEDINKLEQSIVHAQNVIAELVEERNRWRTLYKEIQGQVAMSSGNADLTSVNNMEQLENLIKENRSLRLKLGDVLKKSEQLKEQIKMKLYG